MMDKGAERKAIGRVCREWRDSGMFRLTKEKLAEAIGKSISTVQRWEGGLSEPCVSDLRRMEETKPGLLKRLFAEPK